MKNSKELVFDNNQISLIFRVKDENQFDANENISSVTISNGSTFAYGYELNKMELVQIKEWLNRVLHDMEEKNKNIDKE